MKKLIAAVKSSCSHDWDNCNIGVNLWQHFPHLNLIRKERFPTGKTKLVLETSLWCHTVC